MSNPYGKTLRPDAAPQSEAIPGREAEMTENRAGGVTFKIDHWAQLTRFLILGAEGNTYYASQRNMVLDNAKALQAAIAEDGEAVVKLVAAIDAENRAPKRSTLLFALAVALIQGDDATKAEVIAQLPKIVRTASDLFDFLSAIRDLKSPKGWWASRSVRRAIAAWYNSMPASRLAYQMAKYRERSGFTHRDAMRIAHPKPVDTEHSMLYAYAAGQEFDASLFEGVGKTLYGFKLAANVEPKAIAKLIEDYGLTWEMIPSEALKEPDVWKALMAKMPLRALMRNLGRMTSNGALAPLSDEVAATAAKIGDAELLNRARIHPLNALSALLTYKQGRGFRGSLSWSPLQQITEALERAVELSFANVEETGLRYYIGVDVSSSMEGGVISGIPGLSPAMGAATLALITARREPRHVIKGFSSEGDDRYGFGGWGTGTGLMRDLGIHASDSIADVMTKTDNMTFGRTDCSLPMRDAMKNKIPVDVFVILTDNETWHGKVHPSIALAQYRREMGIPAKLAVVAMTSTGYSIADPADAGMLDMVGFDGAGPEILRNFAKGMI